MEISDHSISKEGESVQVLVKSMYMMFIDKHGMLLTHSVSLGAFNSLFGFILFYLILSDKPFTCFHHFVSICRWFTVI